MSGSLKLPPIFAQNSRRPETSGNGPEDRKDFGPETLTPGPSPKGEGSKAKTGNHKGCPYIEP
jgi:hypothetical protein